MHRTAFRVYYEDTDFSGFVYHANYLRFLERGRTDLLRELGVAQSALKQGADGLVFVVTRIVVDYLRPAKMDDVLTISTSIDAVTGATMTMAQAIHRGEEALVKAMVHIAAVRDGRAVRLPAVLRDRPRDEMPAVSKP